jgi:hypothetical protein
MERDDIIDVLTKAAAFDARTVGEGDVLAWHEALGDLDRDDALKAVTVHYTRHIERLMPAHVRRAVVAIKRDAAQRAARRLHRLEPGRSEGYCRVCDRHQTHPVHAPAKAVAAGGNQALWPDGRCGICGKPSDHAVCWDCTAQEFEQGQPERE